MLEIVEIARLPQRPSDLLEMRESGYSPAARLSVDREFMAFARQFERMRDARKEVAAPKPGKNTRPKMLVPLHSREDLLTFLDIDPADTDIVQTAESMVYDPAMWDAVDDWGDDADVITPERGEDTS